MAYYQTQSTMARLLMINFRFPPAQVVSSKRLGHFYLSAKAVFKEVHVITSELSFKYPSDPLLDIPIESMQVIQHRDFRSSLPLMGSVTSGLKGRAKRGKIGRVLLSFRKRWPFFYLFGDGGADYIAKAVERAKQLIRKHSISHIFTSYGPYADTLIGHKLKQQFPGLIWVADFRDIFDNQPSREGLQRHSLWYMRRKLQNADRLTTVSEGLAERLSQIHPDVSVLYNGMGSLSDHPMGTPSRSALRITYTGSLYDRWEGLRVFFKALQILDGRKGRDNSRVQFRYYGSESEEAEATLRSAAVDIDAIFESTVSMSEALRHQKESHINLLLSWSHPRQKGILNAKLFEYIGARRPIFAIVVGPHDSELQYWVEEVGKGKCYFLSLHTTDEIAQGLDQMILSVRSGEWKASKSLPAKMIWSEQGPAFWKSLLTDNASA